MHTCTTQIETWLQEVTRAGLRLLLNGDASQWDRAMQMPHYNTRSMPAVSLHTGVHLIQVLTWRFNISLPDNSEATLATCLQEA